MDYESNVAVNLDNWGDEAVSVSIGFGRLSTIATVDFVRETV